MAHTDPDDLDAILERRQAATIAESLDVGTTVPTQAFDVHPTHCDSCQLELDPEHAAGRYRHVDCPPPPIPEAVAALLEQMRRPGGAR